MEEAENVGHEVLQGIKSCEKVDWFISFILARHVSWGKLVEVSHKT